MRNSLELVPAYTQRDNMYDSSFTCCPTSAAMKMRFKTKVSFAPEGMQDEDFIYKSAYSLTADEKETLRQQQGAWIFNYKPYQVLPIMEYVCNKIVQPFGFSVVMSWGITFDNIISSIDAGNPVVCLGNFASISKIGGHYNCIIGYDTDTKKVITNDPWGNALTGYTDQNGEKMEYNWSLFCQANQASYGLYIS